jgi:hypothetical protein
MHVSTDEWQIPLTKAAVRLLYIGSTQEFFNTLLGPYAFTRFFSAIMFPTAYQHRIQTGQTEIHSVPN